MLGFLGGISDEQTVISGVPQGTVLGPVLFLILMSDIDKDISESKVVSFADDTRIYHQIDSDDSINQLQTDLNKMYNWSVTNNMLFNASKFQSICYSSHASIDSNFIYKDHVIFQTSKVLVLNLSFSQVANFGILYLITFNVSLINLQWWQKESGPSAILSKKNK